MKILIELASLISNNKPSFNDVIHSEFDKETKVYEFYDAIINNKVKDDKEAALFLYGNGPNQNNYKSLKNSLKQKLANSIFF